MSRRGLLLIAAALALVILVGSTGFLIAKKATSYSPTIPAGYNVFTSPDKSFRIAYPSDWQVSDAGAGTGVRFEGPAHQVVIVTTVAGLTDDPASIDSAFCQGQGGNGGFGGSASSPKTVSIGGQSWTQEECDTGDQSGHAAVAALTYQGNSYLLTYASPKASFNSNQRTFFSPIEGSFQFLK